MAIEPDYPAFAKAYDAGRGQALYARLIADLETPVSAYLKLGDGRDNTFLLESVQGGEARGRYSIIGSKPDLIWRCRGGKAEINRQARGRSGFLRGRRDGGQAAGIPARAVARNSDGIAGRLAADGRGSVRLSRLRHGAADRKAGARRRPIRWTCPMPFSSAPPSWRSSTMCATRSSWSRRCGRKAGVDARAAYARASERLMDAIADLERPAPATPAPPENLPTLSAIDSNITPARYLDIVERAKEYIRAGDIFQVVPSQRFSRPFALPAFALYRALRRLNPSPFLYHLAFPGFTIVGSSPGNPGAAARRRGDDPSHRRHPPARRHAGAGRSARQRTDGRSQGTRRTSHAARSRPQRCRPRRRRSAA